MSDVIFWGATGHAKVLWECLKGKDFNLVALFDNNPDVQSPFPDIPLHYGKNGFRQWQKSRSTGTGQVSFLVAVGGALGVARLELQEYLEGNGLSPLVAVHQTAFVAGSAQIGAGSQVLAQASVCVDVKIGRGCIVNTHANVDHECHLADGVHVSPGATLAGCVEVGRCAMISTGAVVLPRVRIGANAIVGAGAVVIGDVEPNTIVVGNPARFLRKT